MIQLLTLNNQLSAYTIIKDVTTKMRAMGIDQWDEDYPTLDILEKDISKGDAYGFFIDDELAAYVIFNTEFDEEYNDINWLNTSSSFLVMHRLSVSPKFQGRGIAKKVIYFGEKLAIKLGHKSMRFDAYTQNPISNGVYEKIGYKMLGVVKFRKGDFFCYEKNIEG
ncbi:GNAT family N-acetyltransferase [Flammeovirga pectinis]|uniref:GNAT family N-acetyltransferase n=1 Tax=Flammeovirga pectinis TaxID=2494373 RepID=A0A3S9NY88_9BACT|nr:GNAT family N-acetyltransferase [Flammeovirga pectinis]AZQ60921.1 GNAT family N-acetyltransferase [Flammeovirga pectinis]